MVALVIDMVVVDFKGSFPLEFYLSSVRSDVLARLPPSAFDRSIRPYWCRRRRLEGFLRGIPFVILFAFALEG